MNSASYFERNGGRLQPRHDQAVPKSARPISHRLHSRVPYDKVAPDPTQWPTLVAKIKKSVLEFHRVSLAKQLNGITAPVLITLGDRDGVRLEHAVEMFRLIPNSQLAVFPGADHFLILQHPDKLLPPIAEFFDAPIPEAKKP